MTHHGYSPEQTRAILKALYRDGFAPRHVADLLCTTIESVMQVVKQEEINQQQAVALCRFEVSEWVVKGPNRSIFKLGNMRVNEKREIVFTSIEAAILYRKRLTSQSKTMKKRHGLRFTWALVGRTLKYERIE